MKTLLVIGIFFAAASTLHAQNIGIGVANPTKAKLELHGAVGRNSAIFGGDGAGLSLQRDFPGLGFNLYHGSGYNRYLANGWGALQVFDIENGVMRFDLFDPGVKDATTSGGSIISLRKQGVTVGSDDYPSGTLTVTRGSAPGGTAVFNGTKHGSNFNFGLTEDTYIRGGRDGSQVFINDIPNAKVFLGGRVGINSVHPGATLEVLQQDGKGLMLVAPDFYTTCEFVNDGWSGNLSLLFGGVSKGTFRASDGAYSNYSDARLKTAITPLPSLLNKIAELNPVEYEFKNGNPQHRKSIGFIAQDVEKLFPELITVAADTVQGYGGLQNLRSLNYTDFAVIAIKGIQEQQALIQKLQQQVQALEKNIGTLKEGAK